MLLLGILELEYAEDAEIGLSRGMSPKLVLVGS